MRRKPFLIITTSVAIIVILVLSSLSKSSFLVDFLSYPARFMSGLSYQIKDNFTAVFKIKETKSQNEELIEKLARIEVDRSRILELEKENEILKKELNFFQKEEEDSLVPASIIIREPTTFLDHVIIDKGEKDGVFKDMPVVALGTLIGVVKESYSQTSKVVLITSKDSIIQAMLQQSRLKGVLKGGIGGLFLDSVVIENDYTAGDYVVTSGLGGKIKQGILIGKAKDEDLKTSDIYRRIEVEPIVDLAKLETVFVAK